MADQPLIPPVPMADLKPGDRIAINGPGHTGNATAVIDHNQRNPDGTTTLHMTGLVRADD